MLFRSHLLGNLRSFIGAGVGGSRYVRDRDAEFSRRDATRAELLATIGETRREVSSALARLTEITLDAPFPHVVGGRRIQTRLFLLHLLSHLGYHLGQLDYHRRVVTSDPVSIGALPLADLGESAGRS